VSEVTSLCIEGCSNTDGYGVRWKVAERAAYAGAKVKVNTYDVSGLGDCTRAQVSGSPAISAGVSIVVRAPNSEF
jgi:hypothetical protein